MKFQRSEDVTDGGWFDVAFVQVILLSAGRREFDVTLPQTIRTCLNHNDESSPSTGHIHCHKSFILSLLRAYTTACVDIELQSFLSCCALPRAAVRCVNHIYDGSGALAFVRLPVQSGFGQFSPKRK